MARLRISETLLTQALFAGTPPLFFIRWAEFVDGQLILDVEGPDVPEGASEVVAIQQVRTVSAHFEPAP